MLLYGHTHRTKAGTNTHEWTSFGEVSAEAHTCPTDIETSLPVDGYGGFSRKQHHVILPFLLAALSLFLPCHSAHAQRYSGTIIAFVVSNDSVVVATDSRMSNELGRYLDDACKISTPNNKFIFASAGVADWGHEEAISLERGPNQNPRDIAYEWGNRMGRHMLQWPKSEVIATVRRNGNPNISVGIFAIATPRGVEVDRTTIIYQDLGGPRFSFQIAVDIEQPTGMGMPQIIGFDGPFIEISAKTSIRGKQEFNAIASHKGKPDFQEFSALRIVQKTIEWNPNSFHVGGPIDAVRLLRNGTIQWIKRKQNCPAQ